MTWKTNTFSEKDLVITVIKGSAGIMEKNGEHESHSSLDKDSGERFYFLKAF